MLWTAPPLTRKCHRCEVQIIGFLLRDFAASQNVAIGPKRTCLDSGWESALRGKADTAQPHRSQEVAYLSGYHYTPRDSGGRKEKAKGPGLLPGLPYARRLKR